MPNGPHFNLNVVGVPRNKTASMTNGGGTIFVKLWGKSTINLVPGAQFDVLDKNGTDSDGASIMLPTNVTATYSVWVRALGKPGNHADMTTCYTDALGDTYCLGPVIRLERKNGRPVATNYSQELLNVVVCTRFDANGVCTATTTIPLFSDVTLDYLWNYDNSGLKVAQLRFYPLD